MIPIYIPSKGRPNDSYLLEQLKLSGREFYYVVEPAEAHAYLKLVGENHLIVLPEDNCGLNNSRQYTLEHARSAAVHKFAWMLDDDINGFFTYRAKKNIPLTFVEAIAPVEERIESGEKKLGMLGLEYNQYAWSATKPWVENSYADCIACINTTLPIRYRNVVPKEDRDLILQCLSIGYKSLRFTGSSFSAPANGSNEGGLKTVYDSDDAETEACTIMTEFWPGIAKHYVKPSGRHDLKYDWKKAWRCRLKK